MADRIILLGRAGVGKTTLAKLLGEITGGSVICLDAIWQPGWTSTDVPAFREEITLAHAGENWVSDGNFADATFDIRLPRATLILWLDAPRFLCSWRSIVRVFKQGERHQARDLHKVLRFIWRFDKINRPRILAAIHRFGPEIPIRKVYGEKQVAQFLREMKSRSGA